jgi:predicted dehydrogenase
MVDHTFLFTGAVRKIKELVDGGVLGRLYYYDSTRVNLGLFQHDVNVIWDLAPHDFAVIDHLFGLEPEQVVATGQAHLNGHEDLAYITLYFPTDVIAHVNVNWLSPLKVRTTLLGGDKRMLVWNDLEPGEKLKVYDKGVEITSQQGIYDAMVSYRSGDMWAPRLEEGEALQREARHFLDCIATGVRPISDGRAGWRVVRMLEAAQRSVERRGAPVTLGLGEPAPVPAGARRGASAWRPAPVAIPSRP